MEREKISKMQFYTLLFLSILSNDKISGLIGKELYQNKIYAILICLPISVVIFLMYWFIFKNTLFQGLNETLNLLVGKIIGKVFFISYSLYFLLIAAFETRDIMEIIYNYLLDSTPYIILTLIFIFAVYYTFINGLEVLTRVSQLLLNIIIFTILVFFILSVAISEIHYDYLLPILENGFKPIIKPTLLMSMSFPFGRIVIFLFILEFISDKKKAIFSGVLAQLSGGLIIILTFLLNLLILCPDTLPFMLSPPIRLTRIIEIEGFFQRFDLITIQLMIMVSYVKISLLLIGCKFCIDNVINIKIKRKYILHIILCVLVIIISNYTFKNYLTLLKFKKEKLIPYVNTLFEFLIPFILFIISFIKKNKIKNEINVEKSKNEETEIRKRFFTIFNR